MAYLFFNQWELRLLSSRNVIKTLPLSQRINPHDNVKNITSTPQSRAVPIYINKLFINYGSKHEAFKSLLYQVANSKFHTSLYFENENEVKKLLSLPDNKLNQFNTINSNDIMHLIEELKNFNKFIKIEDLEKVLKFTSVAVRREFCPDNKLIKIFWEFLKSFQDVQFTGEYLKGYLSMCLHSHYKIELEDVTKYMEDHNIRLSKEISDLLLRIFSWHGERQVAEKVLALMKAENFEFTESTFSSLLILAGKERDMQGIHNVYLALINAGITPSLVSQGALVVAYHHCRAYLQAKEILETVEKSSAKLTSDQYCDVVSSCVLSGVEKNPEYFEHLQYILDTKTSLALDADMTKVILELLYTDFAPEAIRILGIQDHYRRRPHLSKNGSIFIRELVRAKHKDPSLVVDLCREIMKLNVNNYTFYVALETALSNNYVELAWALLRKLKEMDAPLREHYFWPLLVSKDGRQDSVANLKSVLAGMLELGVNPGFETLCNFVIPNLSSENPETVFQILSKVGISRNKVTTPLIANLISNMMMEPAVQLATESSYLISLEDMTESLTCAYLQDPQKTLQILKKIVLHNREMVPAKAVSTAMAFGPKFVKSITDASKDPLTEKSVTALIEELRKIGIECSESCKSSPSDPLLDEETSPEIPKRRREDGTTHPHSSMSAEELERHLVELKHKGMNTRGVLRRLLMKYSAAKDKKNCSRILKELKLVEGSFSPGMLSSSLYNCILAGNPDEGLEIFWRIQAEFPTFTINTFTVVDLCTLLVRNRRIEEAMDLLQMYVDKAPKEFHNKKAILRNCHDLLKECVAQEEYDSTREMFYLLLNGGLVAPSTVIFGPLVQARLERDGLASAVEEVEKLFSNYGFVPMRVEILKRLMEASLQETTALGKESGEDAAESELNLLFEKMISLIRKSRGLKQLNEDLMLASLEVGHKGQAAKVFEQTEKNLNIERIRFLCNRFVKQEKKEHLLLLLSVSRSSQNVDRAHIYECLLNIYIIHRDSKAALDLWLQAQEDKDLYLTTTFRNRLNKLLKMTGGQSPF